jgi:hypothetical protein
MSFKDASSLHRDSIALPFLIMFEVTFLWPSTAIQMALVGGISYGSFGEFVQEARLFILDDDPCGI